jgi:hypothetical protein
MTELDKRSIAKATTPIAKRRRGGVRRRNTRQQPPGLRIVYRGIWFDSRRKGVQRDAFVVLYDGGVLRDL